MAQIDTTSPQFVKLVNDIRNVWNMIGHDVLESCASCGEGEPDSESMVESCIDADQLTLNNHHDSQLYVRELFAAFGYTQVLQLLARRCYL